MRDSGMLLKARRVHFFGIGGIGMSGLARLMQHRGYTVSGSDLKETELTRGLESSGIQVRYRDDFGMPEGVELVVYSTAIRESHPGMILARELKIPVLHRAQVLSAFFNEAATSIGVTGTHGKTTTSSMISFLLSELGSDPTCLLGGEALDFGSNVRLGKGPFFVAEVDESDKTHELYSPHYAVLTNLELDHPDHYTGMEQVRDSFARFLQTLAHPGLVIYPRADRVLAELVEASGVAKFSFGFDEQADLSAVNIESDAFGSDFDLLECGFFAGRVRINLPGRHNVANALAALSVLLIAGMDLDRLLSALRRFRGTRRRLEVKWQSPDLLVIDDYAHHPTEVAASLEALKRMGERVTVVFQPHRISRTRHFYREFAEALSHADEIWLAEVYGAGEEGCPEFAARLIYDELLKITSAPVRMMKRSDITSDLISRSDIRGVIAFLGAGNIGETASEFASRIKNCTAA